VLRLPLMQQYCSMTKKILYSKAVWKRPRSRRFAIGAKYFWHGLQIRAGGRGRR
jgi:hypothetical protein